MAPKLKTRGTTDLSLFLVLTITNFRDRPLLGFWKPVVDLWRIWGMSWAHPVEIWGNSPFFCSAGWLCFWISAIPTKNEPFLENTVKHLWNHQSGKTYLFWLVVSKMFYFPFHMGCHPSHWRTYIFQRDRSTTNQFLVGGWYFMVSWDGIMATEEGEIKHRRSCSTGFSPPFSLSECWLHFSPWRLPTCDMPNYVFGQINSNTYTYVYYIYIAMHAILPLNIE